MKQRHIYVVLSSTPYRTGKLIRKVTKETYNHASIGLNEDLNPIYSFARRYEQTPLYGGFVEEFPSRFHVEGVDSAIRVYRIAVTQEQYDAVKTRIETMCESKEQYLYNHLSALTAPLHKAVRLRDAYTCVEFCVDILCMIGLDLTPGRYYAISDLMTILEPYTYYTGLMPQQEESNNDYHVQKPVSHPILKTAKSMVSLVPRLKK